MHDLTFDKSSSQAFLTCATIFKAHLVAALYPSSVFNSFPSFPFIKFPFSSVDIWGGKKGLKERVLKDKIKTNWAKKNNYFLYRIAYNENITRCLDKIIKNAT